MNNSRSRWFGRYPQHRDRPYTRKAESVPPRLLGALKRITFRTWSICLAPEAGSDLALTLFYGSPEDPGRLAMSRAFPVEADASAAELVEVVRAAVEEVAGPGAGAELVYRPEGAER